MNAKHIKNLRTVIKVNAFVFLSIVGRSLTAFSTSIFQPRKIVSPRKPFRNNKNNNGKENLVENKFEERNGGEKKGWRIPFT